MLPVRIECTPLLEKELHILLFALPLHIAYPSFLHGPRARSRFTANNHPMDSSKVQFAYVFKQRLNA